MRPARGLASAAYDAVAAAAGAVATVADALVHPAPPDPFELAVEEALSKEPQYVKLRKEMEATYAEEQKIRTRIQQQQTREQAYIRNESLLEQKLSACEKNLVTVRSRQKTVATRLEEVKHTSAILAKKEEAVVTELDRLQETQRMCLEALEITEEELDRTQQSKRSQDDEKGQLESRRNELALLKEKLSKERSSHIELQKRLLAREKEALRHIAMIKGELDAQHASAVADSGADPTGPTSQLKDLEHRRSDLQSQMLKSKARSEALDLEEKSMGEELEQIDSLLKTLQLTSTDIQLCLDALLAKQRTLRIQGRKQNKEAMTYKKELSRLQQEVIDTTSKLDGLQKQHVSMAAEEEKLIQQKAMLTSRLKDVRSGEELLASRIQQDQFFVDALRKKQKQLSQKRLGLARAVRAELQKNGTVKPFSTSFNRSSKRTDDSASKGGRVLPVRTPSGSPPPMGIKEPKSSPSGGPRRGSSGAVSHKVECVLKDGGRVKGTITVTSFLVIFEADRQDDTAHRFCVDMQDVAACRISTGERGAAASTEESGPKALVLSLRDNFRDRFLFDEATGESKKSSVFQSEVRFSASSDVLASLFGALNQSLLFHENVASAREERQYTQAQMSVPLSQHRRESSKDALRTRRGSAPAAAFADGSDSAKAAYSFLVNAVDQSHIVNADQFQQLLHTVPTRFQLEEWRLLYSITTDGTSLHTFYQRTAAHEHTLIIMKDDKGHILGGYAPVQWQVSPNFYGTGDAFVFHFEEQKEETGKEAKKVLRVYKWSAANDFYMFSTSKYIAMGGGENYAFRVDEQLENGTSGPCSTFGSPQLSHAEDFVVHAFEVWAPS